MTILSTWVGLNLNMGNSDHCTENTNKIVIQAFSSIPTLSWVSVNKLVVYFNSEIANIVDVITPSKAKGGGKKMFPWRNHSPAALIFFQQAFSKMFLIAWPQIFYKFSTCLIFLPTGPQNCCHQATLKKEQSRHFTREQL